MFTYTEPNLRCSATIRLGQIHPRYGVWGTKRHSISNLHGGGDVVILKCTPTGRDALWHLGRTDCSCFCLLISQRYLVLCNSEPHLETERVGCEEAQSELV